MKTLSRTFALGLSVFAVAACSSNAPEDSTSTGETDEAAITAVGNSFAAEVASPDVRSSGAAPASDQVKDFTNTPMDSATRELVSAMIGHQLTVGPSTGFTCETAGWEGAPAGSTGLPRLGVAKVTLDIQACRDNHGAVTNTATMFAYDKSNHSLFTYRQGHGVDYAKHIYHTTSLTYGNSSSEAFRYAIKADTNGAHSVLIYLYNPKSLQAKNQAVVTACKLELQARGVRATRRSSSACAVGIGATFLGGFGSALCLFGEVASDGILTGPVYSCLQVSVPITSGGIGGIAYGCFGAPAR